MVETSSVENPKRQRNALSRYRKLIELPRQYVKEYNNQWEPPEKYLLCFLERRGIQYQDIQKQKRRLGRDCFKLLHKERRNLGKRR